MGGVSLLWERRTHHCATLVPGKFCRALLQSSCFILHDCQLLDSLTREAGLFEHVEAVGQDACEVDMQAQCPLRWHHAMSCITVVSLLSANYGRVVEQPSTS